MTELYTKAIVKLPRNSNTNRLSSLLVDTNSTSNSMSMRQYSNNSNNSNNYKGYLVTDKLYFEGLSTVVTESEIMDLVRSFDPIKIYMNRNSHNSNTNDGYIQFMNREMADRAYTLLNGVTTRAMGIRLILKINPPGGNIPEPEAQASILHIKNLPNHMDNNKSLYDLFRPFGPMVLCKILLEQGSTFKGTALVQYFFSENAHDAEISMNNKPVQDNIITVIPFVSSKSKTPPSSSSQTIETTTADPTTTEDLVVRPNRYSNTTTISTPTSPLPPPQQQMNNNNTTSPVRSDGSSMVDYTNLYIKNLDLNVKSADLFNHFRKFGRIISARVMKNAQTKQSKGFGFVSFSKADEAQKAKQDMNGIYILSKPVIVAFHEPKKPRDAVVPVPVTSAANGYNSASPTDSSFTTVVNTPYAQQRSSPPPPPIPSQPINNNLFIDHGYYHHNQQQANTTVKGTRDFIDYRYTNNNNIPVVTAASTQKYNNYPINQQPDHYNMPTKNGNNYHTVMERNNSRQSNHSNHHYDHRQIHIPPHTTPLKRDLSNSGSINQQPSLSALASGAFINTPPPLYYGQQQQTPSTRPTFRRRGSVESVATVMTETTSKTRRQTITKAVLSTIDKSDEVHLHDIVDMLLTLKKKDLATCLFNNIFLKSKIKQAKDALDTFEEQQKQQYSEEEVEVIEKSPPPRYPPIINHVTIPPRSSRAIPIVAPPTTAKSQTKSIDPGNKDLNEEIEKFLSSLKGLEIHEQKQLLGDRLFPLVKSTGVKGAPRITILLLDSVPLQQLAYTMYDKDKLKQQVDGVVSNISSAH